MKKVLLTAMFFSVFSIIVNAMENEMEYKNWKTFKSDYGYELKYPDCFDMRIDNPDEEGDLKKVKHILFFRKKHCHDKSYDVESADSFGIYIEKEIKNKNEFEELVASGKKSHLDRIKINDAVLLKKEIGSYPKEYVGKNFYKLFWLQSLSNIKNEFRWQFELICPHFKFMISGPDIINPDNETLSDLKANRFNIAEPYKTIFDSVKCIEPKIKK